MPDAPEICIEVISPSNALPKLKKKMEAYLTAGAVEAWIVLDDLSVRVFTQDGEQASSRFQVDLEEWRRAAT